MNRQVYTIGFAKTEPHPSEPDVNIKVINEKTYKSTLRKKDIRIDGSSSLLPNINVSNEVSIVADPFMVDNFQNIVYIIMNNSKWKVNNVIIQRPRIILSIGGLYNE